MSSHFLLVRHALTRLVVLLFVVLQYLFSNQVLTSPLVRDASTSHSRVFKLRLQAFGTHSTLQLAKICNRYSGPQA